MSFNRGILSFGLVLIFTSLLGQDSFKSFAELNDAISQDTCFYMELEINAITNESVPVFEKTMKICMQGQNYYYDDGDGEYILSEGLMIYTVNSMKKIMVTQSDLTGDLIAMENRKLFTGSMQKSISSIEMNAKGDTIEYRLYPKKGAFSRVDILANKQNSQITKIVYHYSEPGEFSPKEVYVDIRKYNTDTVYPPETFDIGKILLIKDSNFLPSRKYHDFDIHFIPNGE